MGLLFACFTCWAASAFQALLASPVSIGVNKRVVNGRAMVRGEWPFLVSLHYLKPFPFTQNTHMKHVCGGTLIHPQWVVTAAHCVGFMKPLMNKDNWEVVLGEHNQYLTDRGEQVIKPEAFFTHPGFKPHILHTLENDIALIKLKEAAVMSRNVGTVTRSNATELDKHMACEIGGWGQVSSEPYGWGMYIPLKSTVHVIDNDECADTYSQLTYENGSIRLAVNPSVLCAGIPVAKQSQLQKDRNSGINDACNGDSGSPLLCQTGPNAEYQMVGVVSAGKGCGSGTFPGIYTRVSHYNKWITETINKNSDKKLDIGEEEELKSI